MMGCIWTEDVERGGTLVVIGYIISGT